MFVMLSLIVDWIFFIYTCGFVFKSIINLPMAEKAPDYFEEVFGEEPNGRVYMQMVIVLGSGLAWPYLLLLEKYRFFYSHSDEDNRKFFHGVWNEISKRENQEKH